MMHGFQNWIQISILCGLAVLGFGRAIILKAQKTRVFVLDAQMTKTQFFNGVFFSICFLAWIFESFSYGLSLNYHIPLAVLDKLIIRHSVLKLSGMIVLIFGLAIYAMALYSFRDSWRIGIDRDKPGELITTGVFRYSRNPIYVSLDLLILGTFLLQGRLVFLILFVCLAVSLHIQILQEEDFLIQTYGDAFLSYCSKTGRYINMTLFLR